MLSEEQKTQLERDGYLVVEDFVSAADVGALRTRVGELLEGMDPKTIPVSVFSTDEQCRTSDDYFLSSGDNVSFFYEEGAWNADGTLKQARSECINKIGHALHEQDDVFRRFSFSDKIKQLVASVGWLKKPLMVQSMYIFKQPRLGGKVGAHVDSAFLYTTPDSTMGLWFALEDATLENGCLWAIPGSHKEPVTRRFRRAAGGGTEFVPPEPVEWSQDDFVPCPVKAGSLVLLHGAVVHMSKENRSDKSRHAFSLHLLEGADGYAFPEDNWIRRSPGNPFVALDDVTVDGDAVAGGA